MVDWYVAYAPKNGQIYGRMKKPFYLRFFGQYTAHDWFTNPDGYFFISDVNVDSLSESDSKTIIMSREPTYSHELYIMLEDASVDEEIWFIPYIEEEGPDFTGKIRKYRTTNKSINEGHIVFTYFMSNP